MKVDAATVGVIGLGYVGPTLAAAMARQGHVVFGVDSQPAALDQLRTGRPHLFEPGVPELIAEHLGRRVMLGATLPDEPVDVVVICVSTPIGPDRTPDLSNFAAAAQHVADRCGPGTLVVSAAPSRSVPPGAWCCRSGWRHGEAPVSWWHRSAPSRVRALRELAELPQVIGGLDAANLALGCDFFGAFTTRTVPVSDLETAEFVKLTNNCHTDLIYGFRNEIAVLAGRIGLDPLEVIRTANVDYPRPDTARPGFVGGGCLSKDPYLFIDSAQRNGYAPLPRRCGSAPERGSAGLRGRAGGGVTW